MSKRSKQVASGAGSKFRRRPAVGFRDSVGFVESMGFFDLESPIPEPALHASASIECSKPCSQIVAKKAFEQLEDFSDYRQYSLPIKEIQEMVWKKRVKIYEEVEKYHQECADCKGVVAYCKLRGFGCDRWSVSRCFEEASSALPSDYARLVLGIIFFNQNNLDAAKRHLELCNLGAACWYLGAILVREKDWANAYMVFHTGVEKYDNVYCMNEESYYLSMGWGCVPNPQRSLSLDKRASAKGALSTFLYWFDYSGIDFSVLTWGSADTASKTNQSQRHVDADSWWGRYKRCDFGDTSTDAAVENVVLLPEPSLSLSQPECHADANLSVGGTELSFGDTSSVHLNDKAAPAPAPVIPTPLCESNISAAAALPFPSDSQSECHADANLSVGGTELSFGDTSSNNLNDEDITSISDHILSTDSEEEGLRRYPFWNIIPVGLRAYQSTSSPIVHLSGRATRSSVSLLSVPGPTPIRPIPLQHQSKAKTFNQKKSISRDRSQSRHKRCIHDKRQNLCRDCKGKALCEHKKQKLHCRICRLSRPNNTYCVHNRQRSRCKECGGSGICVHGKERYRCKRCR
jgi:hypothetical protein